VILVFKIINQEPRSELAKYEGG